MSNRTLTLLMGVVAFLIAVVAIVFVVIAVGGGGGDDDSTNTSASSTATTASGSKNTSAVCQGNTLIRVAESPGSGLDPIQVRDVSSSIFVVEIFGGLVTLDRDLKVQPDIAQSWTVSPDGKTYTFKLRNNVVFSQNRRKVTANDVKFSLERAADPREASPTVIAYLGRIQGLADKFNNKAQDISGVKVVDDSTVQITLTEPEPYFLSELTYPVAFVVDKDQVSSRDWTRRPNGTGPFKLAEYTPGTVLRIVKNDAYHLDQAKLDEVRFDLASGSVSTRYQNNEISVADAFPPEWLPDLKAGTHALAKEYREIPGMSVGYIRFNPNQPPFDDPRVRQAMAMTIDVKTINDQLNYGVGRIAKGFLPPEMPGYSETVRGYSYDPAKAKELLAQSKYAGKMPRITLTYAGAAGNSPQSLEFMQQTWKDELGLDVQLQAVEPTTFLREEIKGTFQMQSDGWSADYPDPENFIGKLFASDSPLNTTKYKNADVDNLVRQARTETDQAKRYGLYNQAEQIILNDAVVIPTFWGLDTLLIKPCVKDYPAASMTIPIYKYISIDPNAK